ncbi:MAG: uroporphyrinogen-III synthase [Proteobacteria bacterium]|nr:uroporphyrinogen-III synthase [Pseudomonadota bacterium]
MRPSISGEPWQTLCVVRERVTFSTRSASRVGQIRLWAARGPGVAADSGRLDGAGVIITRAAAQAVELATAIEAAGGCPIVIPVLTIAPPADEAPLRAAVQNLERYDWVVLTSVNAAEAFVARLAPGQRPRAVACVGESTARACRERGMAVDLVPVDFHAEALLDALTERLADALSTQRFLMPRAEEGRETLPEGLRDRGAEVDVVAAYRTLPDPGACEPLRRVLEAGQARVLTFASPSAVTFFLRLLQEGAAVRHQALRLPVVCIGSVTASRACAEGFMTVTVAASSQVSALVEAVVVAICRPDRSTTAGGVTD